MRSAHQKDVAILRADAVAVTIESGGFKNATQFFQAGPPHAWRSERAQGRPARHAASAARPAPCEGRRQSGAP